MAQDVASVVPLPLLLLLPHPLLLLLPLTLDLASPLVLSSSPVPAEVTVTALADAATPGLVSAPLVSLPRRTVAQAAASVVLVLLSLPHRLLDLASPQARNSSPALAEVTVTALADAATPGPVFAPLVSLLRRTVAQAVASGDKVPILRPCNSRWCRNSKTLGQKSFNTRFMLVI